jgi:hypothetical protein
VEAYLGLKLRGSVVGGSLDLVTRVLRSRLLRVRLQIASRTELHVDEENEQTLRAAETLSVRLSRPVSDIFRNYWLSVIWIKRHEIVRK